MPETVASLFHLKSRYLRSAHLERDFADPSALSGYVLTQRSQQTLSELASGLLPRSGRRAWRITGDYGTGKSSLALVMAHLFSGRNDGLPSRLRSAVDFRHLGLIRPKLLPVLVTGAREPLSISLLRSLNWAVVNGLPKSKAARVTREITALLASSANEITDSQVIGVIDRTVKTISEAGQANGLLIILDELGKLLEYAALNPHKQDVFLLQTLAEYAARSGSRPLFVVGLLHQGISSYADQLSESSQREWEKVAGRFDELVFSQPLEQMSLLVADALSIRVEHLPKRLAAEARDAMKVALDTNWYGAAIARKPLVEVANRLYPLHPTVLPPLIKLFSRFGQNERSLFSFLLSSEPFGLQDFSDRTNLGAGFFRLPDLYDYVRTAFGHRLSTLSYRSKWNQIDSIVSSFSDEIELQVLKTVGLINLLDTKEFVASDESVGLALAGAGGPTHKQVKEIVRRLRTKRALYTRGTTGGYFIWPFTSVNVEKAYEDASRGTERASIRISESILPYLDCRPLVARRHYIETGNLRHFDVRFSAVSQLSANVNREAKMADGLIVVALCDNETERQDALTFAQTADHLRERPEILVAVPQPLMALTQLVQELQKWEWVGANTPDLSNDKYAAEEVSRQVAAAKLSLEKRVQDFIGLQRFTGGTELQWFRQHQQLRIRDGRSLLQLLSTLCDEIYSSAPCIRNELINRRVLSSSAAAARVRLMEHLFAHANEDSLGMESDKKPPEKSIYLSVLKAGRIHRKTREGYELVIPEGANDPCRLRPALSCIQKYLEERADSRVRVSEIQSQLRAKPYGVRDGVIPILVAIFAVINEQHVAFYKNGSFLREMSGLNVMHMAKVPEVFEIQYCRVVGVRANVYERLLKVLEIKPVKQKIEILDVVRPLIQFVSQLPDYSRKTNRLSSEAKAVRFALENAKEPATLLFDQLPAACGFKPFRARGQNRGDDITSFIEKLKEAMAELRTAYSRLQERAGRLLIDALDLPQDFSKARAALSERVKQLLIALNEPRLKGFCLRLVDHGLTDTLWLESVCSLVSSMPPSKWIDADEDRYMHELESLALRFRRVESLSFQSRATPGGESAMRISITKADGSEVDDVIYLHREDEKRIAQVESEIVSILNRERRIGLAATVRAFWNASTLRDRGNVEELIDRDAIQT